MRDGFITVAAGTPKVRVGDCHYNAEQIFTLMRQAAKAGVRVLCLPELCVTGYTCGDLFLQETLLSGAQEALRTILEATGHLDLVAVVGMPLQKNNKLYNCAVVIHKGIILGVVPKAHLSNYGDTAEKRWFSAGGPGDGVYTLCGQETWFGTDLIFSCDTMPGLKLGVEICEDLLVPDAPSIGLAAAGATVILNPSASSEVVGRDAYRRMVVTSHSDRLACGYVYANAGDGESTADVVFGGHNIIAENGVVLREKRFENGFVRSEIDVQRLTYARRRNHTYENIDVSEYIEVSFSLEPAKTTLTRHIAPNPFLPEDPAEREACCAEALLLAALGLKKRLEHTNARTAVIGLSGGLDSTLALLIVALAMRMLDRPATDILAITMPCFGTTERTKSNAEVLAERLGATLRIIDIGKSVKSHFQDIGQSMDKHDVTFENGQARERTQVLMDVANQTGGMVIGTGDLSELALGWATYNGDHMSMYGVNGSIPKTMVRYLVEYVARDNLDKDEELTHVLEDILDTPVSPELLPAIEGKIAQKTEDLVGPYELHDFFLYYIVRWGCPPRKVFRMAEHALGKSYDRETILKWLRTFCRRFFVQQFKRNCLPDGPCVSGLSLSPRAGWTMPSDAVSALWMQELEEL